VTNKSGFHYARVLNDTPHLTAIARVANSPPIQFINTARLAARASVNRPGS